MDIHRERNVSLDRPDLLVVTDDLNSAWYRESNLPCHGFITRLTRDSLAALGAFAKDQPDVIVIDFATPAIEAAALARTFRQAAEVSKGLVLLIGIERPDASPEPNDPTISGVDLMLNRDGPGVGAELLRVLNCFCEFLGHLQNSEGPRSDFLELAREMPLRLMVNRTG